MWSFLNEGIDPILIFVLCEGLLGNKKRNIIFVFLALYTNSVSVWCKCGWRGEEKTKPPIAHISGRRFYSITLTYACVTYG